MCVRATKALYTHVQAKEMCNRLGGFLAFAANQTELEAIAKNEMLKLKQEGKTCLAARTVPEKQGNKDVWKLYPMKCDEFLPAACYSYKQVPKYYCGPTDHQKEWFLFRGMCYYVRGGNSQLSAGYWEDGTEYWKWKEESFAKTPTGEAFQYFAEGEPSRSKFKKKCTEENDVDMKNPRSAYGCDYQWLEYCASLIPLRSDVVSSKNEERLQHVKKFAGGRWNDYWCFVPIAGYVCERPADRFIPPEDVDPFEGV
ncbi:hypothetical protein AAVH_24389 [Aphelenchoides avenae]|nr:hypothetical protein AAVH_24389 [Aphelenchus avenae]